MTRKAIQKLKATQLAMKRSILGITRIDRIPNKTIRERTGTIDIVRRITELK